MWERYLACAAHESGVLEQSLALATAVTTSFPEWDDKGATRYLQDGIAWLKEQHT